MREQALAGVDKIRREVACQLVRRALCDVRGGYNVSDCPKVRGIAKLRACPARHVARMSGLIIPEKQMDRG